MRVVAGKFRGRPLVAPKGLATRPTADRVREALFSILFDVDGLSVLDLYAGTGALGIEALSRGARSVMFVERDRRARALIAENLEHCGVPRGCAIIRASFDRLDLADAVDPFDLVLLDPPYDETPDAVMVMLADLLAPGGLLVLEHARRRAAPEAAGLARVRQVASGDSMLSFYGRRDPVDAACRP